GGGCSLLTEISNAWNLPCTLSTLAGVSSRASMAARERASTAEGAAIDCRNSVTMPPSVACSGDDWAGDSDAVEAGAVVLADAAAVRPVEAGEVMPADGGVVPVEAGAASPLEAGALVLVDAGAKRPVDPAAELSVASGTARSEEAGAPLPT